MKKSYLYIAWGVLYALCLGVSFTPNPTGIGEFFLVASALLFFVPPYLLLWRARKEQDRRTVIILRLICIVILALTLLLLCLNFVSVNFSNAAGLVLYVLLTMFSVPMVCGQYWTMSLFLWACLLMLTFQKTNPYQK